MASPPVDDDGGDDDQPRTGLVLCVCACVSVSDYTSLSGGHIYPFAGGGIKEKRDGRSGWTAFLFRSPSMVGSWLVILFFIFFLDRRRRTIYS